MSSLQEFTFMLHHKASSQHKVVDVIRLLDRVLLKLCMSELQIRLTLWMYHINLVWVMILLLLRKIWRTFKKGLKAAWQQEKGSLTINSNAHRKQSCTGPRIVPIFNVADLYSFHGDLPGDLNARDLVQTRMEKTKYLTKGLKYGRRKLGEDPTSGTLPNNLKSSIVRILENEEDFKFKDATNCVGIWNLEDGYPPMSQKLKDLSSPSSPPKSICGTYLSNKSSSPKSQGSSPKISWSL